MVLVMKHYLVLVVMVNLIIKMKLKFYYDIYQVQIKKLILNKKMYQYLEELKNYNQEIVKHKYGFYHKTISIKYHYN